MTDRPAQSAPVCKPGCGTGHMPGDERVAVMWAADDDYGPIWACSEACADAGRPLNPAQTAPACWTEQPDGMPLDSPAVSPPPAQSAPRCAICGRLATCLGAYEGAGTSSYACDSCCAHGCEDGHCEQINPAPSAPPERPGETVRDVMVEAILRETGMDDICDRHGVVAALLNEPRLSITLRAAPPADVAGQTLPPRWERFVCDNFTLSRRAEAREAISRVLAEHDAERAGAQHHYVCDECGRHVSVDEDGCCVQCGEGCALEPCSCDAERAGPNNSTAAEGANEQMGGLAHGVEASRENMAPRPGGGAVHAGAASLAGNASTDPEKAVAGGQAPRGFRVVGRSGPESLEPGPNQWVVDGAGVPRQWANITARLWRTGFDILKPIEPTGTYDCPICGRDTPHRHDEPLPAEQPAPTLPGTLPELDESTKCPICLVHGGGHDIDTHRRTDHSENCATRVGTSRNCDCREQPAPTCRCGSGAHPRRCQVHPNGYAEHCAELSAEYAAEEQAATCGMVYRDGSRVCILPAGHSGNHAADGVSPGPAKAAPDGGRLSERMVPGNAPPWQMVSAWRDEVAALEAKLADSIGWREQCACHEATIARISDKLAAAEERLETALTHASRAERVAEDRKTKLAAAERERDEAVAKERDRIMEIVETYEPRRDVPSDWTFQGALARVSEEIDPRTDPAPTE